jgi:hypothetical protein
MLTGVNPVRRSGESTLNVRVKNPIPARSRAIPITMAKVATLSAK